MGQDKKKTNLAVIGGSGVYNLDLMTKLDEVAVDTPFGETSDKIGRFRLKSGPQTEFYFLARHGRAHAITPSEINYRANIFALKKLGVDFILSVSAVGSLQEHLSPGTFVFPSQFIDWTKGLRKRTFFGEGMVGHVSTAYPVERSLQHGLGAICQDLKIPYAVGGSYVCIEGPQFSSKAESEIYRSFNASVIGMTNVPECYLAKEAGMGYATMAMVTDYDCWKEVHCSLQEIMEVMKKNYLAAQAVLERFLQDYPKLELTVTKENQNAVVTKPEVLTPRHKEILDVILR